MSVQRNLVIIATVTALLAIYVGPERVGQYVNWMMTDPEFFSIPACISLNCLAKMVTCAGNSQCQATLNCITECSLTQPRNRQAMCAYICEVTEGYLNPEFESLMLCMIDNGCMANYPQDGQCVAQETDGVASITHMSQIEGDWWAIKGLNCGHDDQYPGGYDWFPCQHERWSHNSEVDMWQNRISFCAGRDNTCVSHGGGAGIRTVANASINTPGVITHTYDSALSPQIEKWIVVSHPSPDFMLIYWCGNIPIQAYNGGLLLSKHRNDANMPENVREELRKTASNFGLNFDDMCSSDNSWCPES